ncbi:response regulator [Marivirga sp.]|uniref:response regulator n=1 Tax=Marivirga sp. TaxID=2018662 RepID=UPI0025E4BE4C|nr:response regulator [Marivirga sp.]
MATFKNIFLIDDDDLFIFLTKTIIEDEKFADHIHSYEDAREAMEYLKSSDEKPFPEIIFLDINMPMMDGWEFIDALEKSKIKHDIIIYITSSSINPLDLKKAESNPSIKGFISKPLDPAKLKKIAEGRL